MQDFKKITKTLLVATAISGLMVAVATVPEIAHISGQVAVAQELGLSSAQAAEQRAAARAARPKLRSTTGMTERPAKVLGKAQEYMSAEPPRYAEAREELIDQRVDRWNSTEQAAYYQMMAAIAQATDNLPEALDNYKKLLAMDGISYTLRDQITYVVGQIEFSEENYQAAVQIMYDWFQYQPTPSISQIEFFATLHYSLAQEEMDVEKNYRLAIEFLNWAVRKSKEEGKEDKENWYQVLRGIHNNLDEMDKVLEYAELLAARWPKKDYWTQLSNIYAQVAAEDGLSEAEVAVLEKKQLSAFEAVKRQELFDKGREYEQMAQLYLYHDSPYQASKTLAKSFDEGLSESNRRNLELLSTAYINGKDMEEAVEPLSRAAELSDDGNNYMRLANVYLNLDKYQEAADAIGKALDKGGLSRPDQSNILQGQAYLALEQFDNARSSFREAAKDERSSSVARNFLRYVDAEEKRINDIKEYLS